MPSNPETTKALRDLAIKLFEEIANSSDRGMRDGDLARELAEQFLVAVENAK